MVEMGGMTPTRRYGPLQGPTSSSCGGLFLWPRFCLPFVPKKRLAILFWRILSYFGDFSFSALFIFNESAPRPICSICRNFYLMYV